MRKWLLGVGAVCGIIGLTGCASTSALIRPAAGYDALLLHEDAIFELPLGGRAVIPAGTTLVANRTYEGKAVYCGMISYGSFWFGEHTNDMCVGKTGGDLIYYNAYGTPVARWSIPPGMVTKTRM